MFPLALDFKGKIVSIDGCEKCFIILSDDAMFLFLLKNHVDFVHVLLQTPHQGSLVLSE